MKPQPLDLKNIEEKIIDELNEQQPHDLETEIKIFKRVVLQRLKSACEFYLRYKDDPLSLIKDFPSYEKYVSNFSQNCIELKDKTLMKFDFKKYNEWLFRLAFKDVLGDKDE